MLLILHCRKTETQCCIGVGKHCKGLTITLLNQQQRSSLDIMFYRICRVWNMARYNKRSSIVPMLPKQICSFFDRVRPWNNSINMTLANKYSDRIIYLILYDTGRTCSLHKHLLTIVFDYDLSFLNWRNKATT